MRKSTKKFLLTIKKNYEKKFAESFKGNKLQLISYPSGSGGEPVNNKI